MAKEMLYSQKTQIELGKGNVLSAIEFKQKELELERKNGISNKLHYLSVYSELGSLYSYNSQTETALDLYKTVLDSLEKDNLEDNVLYGQCISFVSNLYSIIQRPDMLQHFMKQKKQLLIEKHKTQNYIFAQICNNLSVLQMQINQLDEAFENNALVLPLFLNLYGKQSDNYATALHNKGRILMLQGKHKSALEYLMQSKQIQLEVNNSVYPNTEKYIQDLESK
jgi:tetratricopeptide (TPR) repeat protein